MVVLTLWLLRCGINSGSSAVSGEQPNEAVELRLRCFSRKQIHEETQEVLFPLPLHEFKADPAKYMIRLGLLLLRNCISAAVSDMIVDAILQYMSERCKGEEKEIRRLRIVGEVDDVIRLNWTAVGITKEEEDPHAKSETCSICLDELNGGKREEVEVPCGHVYHDLCICNWLIRNSTCPLCRASLYFPH